MGVMGGLLQPAAGLGRSAPAQLHPRTRKAPSAGLQRYKPYPDTNGGRGREGEGWRVYGRGLTLALEVGRERKGGPAHPAAPRAAIVAFPPLSYHPVPAPRQATDAVREHELYIEARGLASEARQEQAI